MIEVLIALFTLVLIQPVIISAFHLIVQIDFAWALRQNQLGLIQLRRKVAQGVKLSVLKDTLSFDLDNQRITMKCSEDSVIQQPGNMPYLIELSDCEWKQQESYVVLVWSMNEVHYEHIIGILN